MAFSLVIITHNEESNIQRCIESVPIADEVIVVDSGSIDATVSIAQRLGAKVHNQNWLGFGPQKNHGMSLAANDWILSLDADEALSAAALSELEDLCSRELDPRSAYSFPRMTYLMGRGLRYGGHYPDRQIRFFHRSNAKWSDDQVHEKLLHSQHLKLKSDILHWSFPSIQQQIATINKYSSLRADSWWKAGRRASVVYILVKPWLKFMQSYFFKLGFLDGLPGLEAAVVGSFSYFLRLAKLRELEAKEGQKSSRTHCAKAHKP